MKTPDGDRAIKAGQVIILPADKAAILIKAGKVRPLRVTFEKLFHEHMGRMRKLQCPEELKRRDPETYKVIQTTTRAMDSAWYKEDMEGFKKAMFSLELRYREAGQQGCKKTI